MQLDFWNSFREFAQEAGTFLKLRKTHPQHWYDISAGSTSWHIALTTNTNSNQMACEAYMPDDQELYEKFAGHCQAIEAAIGSELEWMPLENKRASRVKLSTACELGDLERWPEYFKWLLDEAQKFHRVFNQFV
jgi:Domain of unknown function (DUF4268)